MANVYGQDAVPIVEIDAPANVPLGGSFGFTVSFDNQSPNQTGYGPFIDLAFDATGADGFWDPLADPPMIFPPPPGSTNEFDGLTISPNVTYLGTPLPASDVQVFAFDDTANGGLGVAHPYAKDTNGLPVYVRTEDFGPPGRFQNGDGVMVVRLPFGSFTPSQPVAELSFSADISELADSGVPLVMTARGGFMFGNDPMDNPTVDPSIICDLCEVDLGVSPTVIQLNKTYIGPESETATGPNFPRRYRLTVDVAEGQEIADLRIIDILPNTMQFIRVTDSNRVSGSGAITEIQSPSTNIPGGTLEFSFGTVTGTVSSADAMLEFEFFVPRLDSNNVEVLNAVTGDDRLLPNQAYTYGDWTPIDERDDPARVADRATVDGEDVIPSEEPEHQLSAQSIAIQKGVSVLEGGPPLPEKTLVYTLEFQISDYFAFTNVVIEDIISDGQRFDTNFMPTLSFTEHGTTLSGAMDPANFMITNFFSDPPAPSHLANDPPNDGTTVLEFRISDELVTRGTNSNLVGGGIDSDVTGLANGPYNNPPLPHGGTVGTLVFRTVVQDRYSDNFPSGNPSLNPRDGLWNTVVISGDLLDPADLSARGTSEDDDSGASLNLPAPTLIKSIYAIDGSTNLPNPLSLRPGETVTFRLETDLFTGDIDLFQISDFVPLPILKVDDPNNDSSPPNWPRYTGVSDAPPSGQWAYGPTDTFSQGADLVPPFDDPDVSIDAGSGNNTIIFDFGTYDDTNNLPRKVDLLFTMTVNNQPFADNLLLMNQAQARDRNTVSDIAENEVITPFTLNQPNVNVFKGVLGHTQVGGFTLGGVEYEGPGEATILATAQTLTTQAQTDAVRDSNLTDDPLPDAHDRVRYGVVLFNSGRADAYVVVIEETLPEAYIHDFVDTAAFISGVNFIVQRGTGLVLAEGDDYVLAWDNNTRTFTLELVDNHVSAFGTGSLKNGLDSNGNPVNNGSNIVVVAYDLLLPEEHPADTTIPNTVTLTQFAGAEDGPNHIPGGREDDAEVRTATPDFAKTLTTTEIVDAHNSATEVVIGELVTYTLTITVPEGVTPAATLTDTLDSGLAFVDIVSVTLSDDVSTANTIGTGTNPFNVEITNNGRTVTYNFGDIDNENDNNSVNETITIVYRAVVLNVSGNQANTTLNNTASFDYTGSDGPLSDTSDFVTVIEPVVTLTKQVSDDSSGPWTDRLEDLDAGDFFYYQIIVTNAAANSTTAYNLTLLDEVPVELDTLSFVSVTGAFGASDFEFAGNTLQVNQTTHPNGLTLQPGQHFIITFEARTSGVVEPAQVVNNEATVFWTSLDDGLATGDTRTPRSIHNDDSIERNGSASVDTYLSFDDADVVIVVPDPEKSLVSSSEAHTAGSTLAIGEIARFRLAWQIPEGTSTDLSFIDVLPSGLRYLDDETATIAFVSLDNSLSSSEAALSGAGLWVSNSIPNVTPTFEFPGSLLSPAAFDSGTNPSFSLGTVENTNRIDTDPEYIVIEFNAIAVNEVANLAGRSLTNRFEVWKEGAALATSDVAVVTLHEPNLTVTKAITSSSPYEAGDTVTYEVVITNIDDDFVTTAFDVEFTDPLPVAFLTNASVVSISSNGVVNNAEASFTGNSLTITAGSMERDSSITVTYQAVLVDELLAGQIVVNEVTGTFTSLPGNGTNPNPTGSVTPGASGTLYGQRDGSNGEAGAPNNYERSDDDSLTANIPRMDKAWKDGTLTEDNTNVASSLSNRVVIGETATFDIRVTVPEGVSQSVEILEYLPPNLRLDGFTLITNAAGSGMLSSDFAGTVNVPTPTPALPVVGGGVSDPIVFGFGNVTATADNDPSTKSFVLRLETMVINTNINQEGATFTNTAALRFTDPQTGVELVEDENPGNDPELILVEPILTVDKQAVPNFPDAGDVITYTFVVTNISEQTGYDFELLDGIPPQLGSLDLTTNPGGNFEIVTINGTNFLQTIAPIDVLAGEGFTIEFTGVLAQDVFPNQLIENQVEISWTSYPGANPDERDGSDGPGGDLNDYADDDDASIRIANIDVDKELWATSETNDPPDSVGNSVQIGEVVTYRIAVTIPEGTVTNLTVTDILSNTGLAYVGGSVIVDESAFDGKLGTLVVAPALAANELAAAGADVTFTFTDETIVNATAGTESNTVYLLVDYLVLDNGANIGLGDSPTIHTNRAEVTYVANPAGPVVSGPVTTTVIEPEIGITKTIEPYDVDAGDTITVTLVVTNTGTATAYDMLITDNVSLFGGDFSSVAETNAPDGFLFDLSGGPVLAIRSDPDAAVDERVIMAGGSKTFSFDINLGQNYSPNTLYSNTVNVVGDSLEGTNIWAVQRITQDSDNAEFLIRNFELEKILFSTSEVETADSTGSNVQIGEVATYRLTAELPEGTITDLTIVDFVPDGMAFVVGSVSVDTNDFVGTLPPPTVTPNIGLLGGDGENVEIVFTGNTIVAGGPGTSDNILRITLDLITLNTNGNVGLPPQTILTNTAHITFAGNPEPPVETDPVTVTVVEPELAITKTVTPNSGDAGDPILVTLVLTNSGTATAYDLEVSDELLGSMFNIATVTNVTMPDGFTFEVVTNAPDATVFYRTDDVNFAQPTNALPIDESLTFQFSVHLSQAVEPGQLLTNVAFFSADTIDGTNVFDVDREYEVSDSDTLDIDDMSIEKALIGTSETGPADSTDSDVQIGEVATYRLTVTLPESTITNLTVVDVVPSGMRYVSGSVSVNDTDFGGILPLPPSVATAGGSGDAITITFDGLTIVDDDNNPANNSFTIDLELLVLDVAGNTGTVEGAQTILPNFATIAFDGNPPADTSSVVNVTVVEPLLAIEKTLSEAVNNIVQVDIVLTNSGMATAYDIVLTDELPSIWWDTWTVTDDNTPDGFTFEITGAPGDATVTYASDPSSGQPTNTLVAGEALLFRFSVELAENAPVPVTNVAAVVYTSIEGDGPEEEQRNYGPIEDEDILVFPAVSHEKTLVSPLGRAAAVGETVVFEIEVSNIGGLELDPVEVTDLFDTTHLNFLSAVPPQDDITGGTITWTNIGPLDVGVSTTLVVSFEARLSTKPGDTTNVVETSAFTTNGVPLRPLTNEAPVAISNPGYIMTKARTIPADGVVASPGDSIQFTIDIVNTGDVTLVIVPVVDTFQTAYLMYDNADPAPDFVFSGTLFWQDVGPIEPGTTNSIVVDFTAVASTLGTTATNTVATFPTVPPGEPPVPPSTNTAPYQISVPGYTLEKTNIAPGPDNAAQVGDPITFQITITNTGDVELETVPVVDTFDWTLLEFDSSVPAASSNDTGVVYWDDIGPLPVGQATNITAIFTALQSTDGMAETNTVSAAPSTPPGFPVVPPATNDAPYRVSQVGYTLEKTNENPGAENAAQVGDPITFQITITNTGDVELVTVPVMDTFDSTYLAFASSDPAASSNDTGVVYWDDIGPLPVGQATNITAIFTALQSSLGSAETNTVSTAPTTPPEAPDAPPATNTAPYRISRAGYTLEKTNVDPGPTDSVAVGGTIEFQITITNTGDVELVTVPVEDTFDDTYLAFDSAIPVQSSTGVGTVLWADIGPLPVGQETNIQVVFTTLASTLGLSETNTVSTAPTTPPGSPEVPPSTNDAPYRITAPGYTLTKTLESPLGRPALVGEAVQFSLTVVNTGDVALVTIPLQDEYDPDILIYVNAVPASDSDSPGNIEWFDIGPLGAGASTSVVVNFIARAPTPGETNTVVASPTTPPEDPDVPPLTNSAPYEIILPAAVGNYVWLDENSDGFQDAGEPGIPNVRVNLYDENGDLVATTVTDTDGGYLFTGLPPGTYYVDVEDGTHGTPYSLPFAGMTQTTNYTLPNADFGNQDHSTTTIPNTTLTGYKVTLVAGEINRTADFGYNYSSTDEVLYDYGLGAIGDRVWFDANGDGVQDAGEPGIPNVWVQLFYDSDGDGNYSAPYDVNGYNPLQQTDANGNYMFTDLPPGAYEVRIIPLNFNPGQPLHNHTQTGDPDYFGTTGPVQDNRTTMPIILAPGDVFLNADFGYQPPASQNNSVGDTVWFDLNANGVQDLDEPGIAGVTVTLIRDVAGNGEWSDGDPIIATTTTDENGKYLFTGVPDGNYLVWVNDVNGVLIGLSQTYDSDGIETPNISAVALDPNGEEDDPVEDLDQDFGYTVLGHTTGAGLIGDRVWLDINSDGEQDVNEPGIPGIVMELYDANTNLIASTVTGADGYYYFGGLETGTYTVVVATPPPGLNQTYDADDGTGPFDTPHQSTVTIGGTEPLINLDQDFGYVGPGRIGDQIWEDRNADGVFDPATESGIPGVTLDLYWDLDGTGTVSPGDPKVGTTVTDANGEYIFEGLSVDDGSGSANYVVVVTDEFNVLNGYWKSSGPNPGDNNNSQSDPYPVVLTPDEPEDLTADFGYYVEGAALGNRVWFDQNGNGRQDPGEPGIAGVKLTLTIIYPSGVTNQVVTVSDADGFYSFGNLLLDENQNGDNAATPEFIISVENPNLPYAPNHAERLTGEAWEDSDNPLGTIAYTWQGLTNVDLNEDDPYDPGAEPSPAWYDFGFTPHPTLVVISGVRSRIEEGVAVISWDVTLEVDTVGYYLERWVGDDWVRVNEELISANPTIPAPKTYEQADPGAPLGTTQRYRIIELDGYGHLLEYGPYDLDLDGGEISYETWAAEIDWGDADSSPDADPDGDGLTNFQEYLAGTDPLNPNSLLKIEDVVHVPGGVRLTWQSAAGRTYTVEMALSLRDAFWAIATDIEATPPENVEILPVDAPEGAFFRVIVE